jgi:hypothetical protein
MFLLDSKHKAFILARPDKSGWPPRKCKTENLRDLFPRKDWKYHFPFASVFFLKSAQLFFINIVSVKGGYLLKQSGNKERYSN